LGESFVCSNSLGQAVLTRMAISAAQAME
jgi:hypothetical protein